MKNLQYILYGILVVIAVPILPLIFAVIILLWIFPSLGFQIAGRLSPDEDMHPDPFRI